MIITLKERLIFSSILTEASNIVGMTIQRDIRKKLEPTQEMLTKAEVTVGADRNMRWDPEKAKEIEVEVEFTKAELDHLKECARKADQSNKVTEDNLDFIQKIQAA